MGFNLTKEQEESIFEIFEISFYDLIETKEPFFIAYTDKYRYLLELNYKNFTFCLTRDLVD